MTCKNPVSVNYVIFLCQVTYFPISPSLIIPISWVYRCCVPPCPIFALLRCLCPNILKVSSDAFSKIQVHILVYDSILSVHAFCCTFIHCSKLYNPEMYNISLLLLLFLFSCIITLIFQVWLSIVSWKF